MKLFLVGGFLGSGKTTAIKNAAKELSENKTEVGVITNDQGVQLVDSRYIQSFDIPTRQVINGCFCCNYDDLEESVRSLQKANEPEIIFAESVGSCTDIISTVVNPFEQFYPSDCVLLSIFADARILPVLMQDDSHFFDDNIHYIYKKQLEEADILVVNKTDLVSNIDLKKVKSIVEDRYSEKTVLYQNSLNKAHIHRWLEVLNEHYPAAERKALDIDYDTYGAGEAKLGWVDGEVEIHAIDNKATGWAHQLIKKIYSEIDKQELPIGHLKFFIKDGKFQKKVSFTAINRPLANLEFKDYETNKVTVLINARVQASPGQLKQIVSDDVNEIENISNVKVVNREMKAFKPAYPEPTYRITS